MGNSDGKDVGFKYEWSGDEFTTTKWTYYVSREEPMQFRVLGVVKRDLAMRGPRLHHYVAFENAQHTNRKFTNLEEAKAWVVACTMGEKP